MKSQGTFSSFDTPLNAPKTTTFLLVAAEERLVFVKDESWINLLDDLHELLEKRKFPLQAQFSPVKQS